MKRILMVAPEPIFEPRGTPFSVVGRLKAYSDMGHRVDLVTYGIGNDVDLPNIRFLRISAVPGIHQIKIGPSLAKLPLDFLLVVKTTVQLFRNSYDLVHTHEEAGLWGTFLARLFRTPHIYDMHSSLPQQLANFRFSSSKLLFKLFECMERWVLKYASAVITICPDLKDHVASEFPDRGSTLIENVVDYNAIFGEKDLSEMIRHEYRLDGKRVILYTGTLEAYQGLELLIQSARIVKEQVKNARFLIVGGHTDQIAYYRKMSQDAGLDNCMVFTGQVPPEQVSSYIRCCEILASPRIAGTNTPLKVYQYLRSGKPVVATRIFSHSQVLSETDTLLTEPTPEAFADGIMQLLINPDKSREIVRAARALAEAKYSYSVYLEKMDSVLNLAIKRGA